jgi:hypothetical protein
VNLSDYGPAFPVVDEEGTANTGMSLRDYFANGPMTEAEFETLRESYSLKFPGQPLSIGRMRYWRAETMLEAREQWYNEHQTPAPVVEPGGLKPGEDVPFEEVK